MKSIAIYTSTRADFGLLKPLINQLISNKKLEVRIFAAGTHFDKNFGNTIEEIEVAFPQHVFYKIHQNMNEDPQLRNIRVMSESLLLYSQYLQKDPPDFAIVLGDRHEALCFGLACSSLNIPLAHLHGGELTYGALDDKFRHCLTKLSNWHFTACEIYRQRVIQMGENPADVFNVGALGVENALHHKLMSREELQNDLGIKIPAETYLFTFHPETNSADYGAEILKSFLMKVADRLKSHNAFVIITGVNSDPGAQAIRNILNDFQAQLGSQYVYMKESLGLTRYLSVMKIATAVLGNSSSGILEAYSLKTPTLNIGNRQEGRERETSVIDLGSVSDCMRFNFDTVVRMKNNLTETNTPSTFGNGRTSGLIADRIDQITHDNREFTFKKFFDVQIIK